MPMAEGLIEKVRKILDSTCSKDRPHPLTKESLNASEINGGRKLYYS